MVPNFMTVHSSIRVLMLEYQQRFEQTQQSIKVFMHCEFNSFTRYPYKYQMRSEITLLYSLIRPGVRLTCSDTSVWCTC